MALLGELVRVLLRFFAWMVILIVAVSLAIWLYATFKNKTYIIDVYNESSDKITVNSYKVEGIVYSSKEQVLTHRNKWKKIERHLAGSFKAFDPEVLQLNIKNKTTDSANKLSCIIHDEHNVGGVIDIHYEGNDRFKCAFEPFPSSD